MTERIMVTSSFVWLFGRQPWYRYLRYPVPDKCPRGYASCLSVYPSNHFGSGTERNSQVPDFPWSVCLNLRGSPSLANASAHNDFQLAKIMSVLRLGLDTIRKGHPRIHNTGTIRWKEMKRGAFPFGGSDQDLHLTLMRWRYGMIDWKQSRVQAMLPTTVNILTVCGVVGNCSEKISIIDTLRATRSSLLIDILS
jgi:hypothetical protein